MDYSPETQNSLASRASSQSLRSDWIGLGGFFLLACFAWIPDSYYKMVGWPWILIWQAGFWTLAVSFYLRLRQFDRPVRLLGVGLDWAVLGLICSLVLSSLTAQFPFLAAQNSLVALFYLLTLYGIRNTTLPWLQGQKLVQVLVFVGGLSSLIGLVFWQPNVSMWLSNDFSDALRNRFPLGHHNFAGGFWVLLLPLAIGLALHHTGWQRGVNSLISLMLAIALYASGSRGAWLGAIVIVVITLGHLVLQSRKTNRWQIVLGSVVALSVIVLLLLSNPRVRNLVQVQSLTEPSGFSITRLSDGPTIDRYYMAQASSNLFKAHPLLGVGPGNLGRVYDLYRPIDVGLGLDQVQQVHNLPLQILVELGLFGFCAYLWGLVCCVKLWLSLRRQVPVRLVNAIGLSFVGYSVSSLTDYQLENIPIAITVLSLLALLVQWSDAGSDKSIEPQGWQKALSIEQSSSGVVLPGLSSSARRWMSLLLLILLGISLQFWIRSTLTIALTHQGLKAIQSRNFVQADTQFYRAAKVAPWDPTPSVLAAEQMLELAQESDSSSDQKTLWQEAKALYQQALKAAPNDIWFNNNLAVLMLSDAPEMAYVQARKTIQLSPRNRNYSYYLLGLTYLDMGQPTQAIEAFALESLVHPDFALLPLWDSPEFEGMRSQFLTRTLQNYETLLSQMSPQSRLYPKLYEHVQIVHWWANLAQTEALSDEVNEQSERVVTSATSTLKDINLKPLTQALLQIEDDPGQALRILNRCILDVPMQMRACRLLRAWLQPDNYLADYLDQMDLRHDEKEQVVSNIQSHQNLRAWLTSTTTSLPERQRFGLALIYRNFYANSILSILRPTPLSTYTLVDLLTLAPGMPRDFPILDRLLETLRTEKLGFSHPTHNQFQLMP